MFLLKFLMEDFLQNNYFLKSVFLIMVETYAKLEVFNSSFDWAKNVFQLQVLFIYVHCSIQTNKLIYFNLLMHYKIYLLQIGLSHFAISDWILNFKLFVDKLFASSFCNDERKKFLMKCLIGPYFWVYDFLDIVLYIF